MDSKKEEEENEKTEGQKVRLVSQKSLKLHKKSKKKDGNKQKQKKNKLRIMTFFFIKVNISFIVKIITIIIISLTYYIISIFIETTKKNEFLTFDEINNEIIETFKESFDIFLIFKKQLEIYEENLSNCNCTKDNKTLYEMDVPLISEIKTPHLGDSIVQINGESGFKKETIEELGEFFSGDACEILKKKTNETLEYCKYILNGALTKGMEQTFTKMGSTIGTIIEEFNSLNNGGKEFKDLILSYSTFSNYEVFMELYFQKAYLTSYDIFVKLRSEKLNSINNLLKIILILYVILFNVLVILIICFIYGTKSIYNSFLNFIWILPVKYLSEDEIFYKEIIKFGKNSYT